MNRREKKRKLRKILFLRSFSMASDCLQNHREHKKNLFNSFFSCESFIIAEKISIKIVLINIEVKFFGNID